MQKVISVNLNGHAYQLDESGYHTLREYLARAEQALSENPDRAEIVADLEQAIADKCQRYLSAHKTVVTSGEVDAIVAEMGPVEGTAGESTHAAAASDAKAAPAAPRRLYRIMDGAVIAGVCNGIAAFFQIDVTLVRIGFIITALITKGAGILAYVVAMIVVPEATASEARAAGSGTPLNAQEVIERARKQYAAGRREWQRRWRQQRRQWRRYQWGAAGPMAYAPPPWTAVLLPLFGLIHILLFVVMGAMLISLVNTGAILDWQLPPDIPLWAGALMLLVVYQIAVSPLRAFDRWRSFPRPGVEPAWVAFWTTGTWLVGAAIVIWIASDHIPEIREFLQRLPELIRDFAYAVRDAFAKDER
jgi:phage shock protein PspC (stress-responsive transcriptional regulator)